MPCNLCGEPYRGLAGDCRCTNYGMQFAETPVVTREQQIRQAQLERAKLTNNCNLCGKFVAFPLARHSACDERERRRREEFVRGPYAMPTKKELEELLPDVTKLMSGPRPYEPDLKLQFKRYAFEEDV